MYVLEVTWLEHMTIFVKKECKKFVHVGSKWYYMRKVKVTNLYKSGGTRVRHWLRIWKVRGSRPRCHLSIEIGK